MNKYVMPLVAGGFVALAGVQPLPVLAMGSSSNMDAMSSDKSSESVLADAQKALDSKDYQGAIMKLTSVIEADSKNADAFNLIGFAYRKLENYPKSLEYYEEALRLDPEHRGAHEYLGTAYVEMGQLDKAAEHLATLQKICFVGCEEFDSLKKKLDQATGS